MKKILIIAGIHGDEVSAVLTAYEIKEWVEKNSLKNITIIPRANKIAYCLGLKENPEDKKNLNRTFPGKKDGTFSERLAFKIFNFAKNFDYVIDLHNYANGRTCLPFILTDLKKQFNKDFANKVGLSYAVRCLGNKGQLFIELSKKNIPSMIIEFGSSEKVERKYIEIVKKAVINFIQNKKNAKVNFIDYKKIKAPSAGKFISKVCLGKIVNKGDVLGLMNKNQIKADSSGIILGVLKDTKNCNKEETLFAVGNL
ncbi:succinylglutamate desuccinylase/aspartoacylase family protein [Candidatus Pacearchaeota archaeon]|nr:succinylglutamate desuccinylase/aspartoacylase family protein [Candidatus Pacearchaeota archaeon]